VCRLRDVAVPRASHGVAQSLRGCHAGRVLVTSVAAASETPKRILVIEDEADIARTIEYNLRGAGFEVATAPTGRDALARVQAFAPDLITLDLLLPDMLGTDVFRALRTAPGTRTTPIVVVSARGDEVDRVVLFELGADDYVTKPFSVRELVLRVQARLRRDSAPAAPPGRARFGVLDLDLDAHRVFVAETEVGLTPIEFRLLATLFERRNHVLSREVLLRDVWQMRPSTGSRTVDTHIKRLREKLGTAGAYVHTVRGIGYRFAGHPQDLADPLAG
jgi:two-component system phosphate regulon response regulator PhoB